MARTKEFWIYQQSSAESPWAIVNYITYDKARELPYQYRFDTVIYCERIPNTHSDSTLFNRIYANGDEFAAAVAKVMAKYGIIVSDDDVDQLIGAWMKQIIDC